ncbi:MAG: glycyl-radical enzyme activating protein [Bacillota bacterium]|nr:MAG: glycyl-radical enzyme activating protein [Bacillota bacterium]
MASAEPRPGRRRDEAKVFSIQHFCLHDGPGVRSLIFFKGCPLRCSWCQNPESWDTGPELAFKARLCIGCGTCRLVCSHGAIRVPAHPWRDPSRCRGCFTCAEKCPTGALSRFGEPVTVDGLVEEVRPEFPLYRSSGGGVTLSGGEPTLQPEFAAALAGRLRSYGVSVAVETCGLFDMDGSGAVRDLLNNVDLVLFDVKVYDEESFGRLCGGGGTGAGKAASRIRDNLMALADGLGSRRGPRVWPRLPLIPGMTDGRENLAAWAGFLRKAGFGGLTIVPYHALGESKRVWLGLDRGPALAAPAAEDVEAAAGIFRSVGIRVFSPGEEAWEAGTRAG